MPQPPTTTPHTNELKHSKNHSQTTNSNPTTPKPCLSTAASTHHASTLPTTTTSTHQHPRMDNDPPPAKHMHTPLMATGVHNDGPTPPPTNDDGAPLTPLPVHPSCHPPFFPSPILPPSFLPHFLYLPLPFFLPPFLPSSSLLSYPFI
ncbi:hypothetical protein K443DRAFT_15845 [Laccaria amethystina LaAM-08-1]|uniref:Uncharacterized protein n=1 Tax=Laccaria amethystina LaAM-08-1 TaxID=1095629 RepID=A0A0C9WGM8_9AGAR|nr:hypothetical protein K443DRAFT_15845 [Laccaria amethystina LaAM-08-1]